MPRKRKDITGQKFNKLTAIKYITTKHRHNIWLFKCDCGNEKETTINHVVKGVTKSCGCLYTKIRENNNRYTGYKEISGKYLSNIRKRAKNRKLENNITLEQMWNLFIKQDRKCALSGVELKFREHSKDSEATASLDRINSTKGYTIDNVQWTHKWVNIMKQDMNDKEFIEWCETITDFNRKKRNG